MLINCRVDLSTVKIKSKPKFMVGKPTLRETNNE